MLDFDVVILERLSVCTYHITPGNCFFVSQLFPAGGTNSSGLACVETVVVLHVGCWFLSELICDLTPLDFSLPPKRCFRSLRLDPFLS